jgi:hypothetical protein
MTHGRPVILRVRRSSLYDPLGIVEEFKKVWIRTKS